MFSEFISESKNFKRAFTSLEFILACVIFGILGVVCAITTLNVVKNTQNLSSTNLLETQIAILRIQRLLENSARVDFDAQGARFFVLDNEKIIGYGAQDFENPNFSGDTLLPRVNLEIANFDGNFLDFSTPHGYENLGGIALICQNPQGSSDFGTHIARIKNIVSNTRLEIEILLNSENVSVANMVSGGSVVNGGNVASAGNVTSGGSVSGSANVAVASALNLCRIALPLDSEIYEILHADTTLFLNGEILLNGVQNISFSRDENFIDFKLCLTNHKCYHASSPTGARVIFADF